MLDTFGGLLQAQIYRYKHLEQLAKGWKKKEDISCEIERLKRIIAKQKHEATRKY